MPDKFYSIHTTTHMSVTRRMPKKSAYSQSNSMTFNFDLHPAHAKVNFKKANVDSFYISLVTENGYGLTSVADI